MSEAVKIAVTPFGDGQHKVTANDNGRAFFEEAIDLDDAAAVDRVATELAQRADLDASAVAGELARLAKLANAPRRPEPYQRYPVGTLPHGVRSFVSEAANSLGVDPVFVALPALAMLASCIGVRRSIRIKTDWAEPCIIWGAIVADSGTKKSPATRIVMRALHSVQREAVEEYRTELDRYESALRAFKTSKGEGSEPSKPTCRRHIVSDTTSEALALVLEQNPEGVLLERDEIGGWLADLDRYTASKGGDAARWLSIWSAAPIVVDRVTRPAVYITRPHVSIYGGIQPRVLERLVGSEHRENGLLFRLLIAAPPRRVARWTDATVSERTAERFAELVRGLLALNPNAGLDGEPRPVPVIMSAEAKAHFVGWYNVNADRLAEARGDEAAALAKMPAHAARLALVFYCIRLVSGERTGDEIDLASVQGACQLVDWHKNEMLRLLERFSETDDDREIRELVDWIARQGGTVTARDLMRHGRRYVTAEAAKAALDGLARAGFGQWETLPQDGRGHPTTRFVLTPADSADVDKNSAAGGASGISVSVNTVNAPENPLPAPDDEAGWRAMGT